MKTLHHSSLCAALIAVAGLSLLLAATNGCVTSKMTEGDVALLAQDLKDVAREGTIYALTEKPEWRTNVIRARDQLSLFSTQPGPVTFDSMLEVLRQLPIEELKSTEARLAITAARITLRRAGRNIELGDITNQKPLARGLAEGITDGLSFTQ